MQVITSQLSDRIEKLIDMTAPEPAPTSNVATSQVAAPAPTSTSTATTRAAATPAMTEQEQMSHRVADALGEAAVLLNTVNVQGMGRGTNFSSRLTPLGETVGNPSRAGGRGADANATGRGASGGFRRPDGSGQGVGRGTSAGANADSSRSAGAADAAKPATADATKPASGDPTKPIVPAMPSMPQIPTFTTQTPPSGGRRDGKPTSFTMRPTPAGAAPGVTPPTPPGGPGAPTPPGTPNPRVVVSTDDGMKIDLTQIRRDIYREILPQQTAEQLTPEERQRVAREVNQRMLGIVEGIKLSAAEIQKQAEEARQKADSASKVADKTRSSAKTMASADAASGVPAAKPAATASPAAPAPVAAPDPVAAVAPTPPAPAAAPQRPMAPLKRTAEFTGNRLDVRFERNGQVVRTVNAEINLPNMLMTVLSSTPHDKGEVPFAVDKDGKVYAQSDEDKKRVEEFGALATPNGRAGQDRVAGLDRGDDRGSGRDRTAVWHRAARRVTR